MMTIISNKTIKLIISLALSATTLLLYGESCSKTISPIDSETEPDEPNKEVNTEYELSYWIDVDLQGKGLRGFWYDVTSSNPETIPDNINLQIKNACQKLRNTYGATKLYVIYHRQFEITQAKDILRIWHSEGTSNGIEIVPTIVLQSYSNNQTMNFSNDEIEALADWTVKSINQKKMGIYDHHTRDRKGQPQADQILLIKGIIGNKLVMIGQQPGVEIQENYSYAVQDTWTAECQGRTNDLWENPVYFKGTNIYGRKLLEVWVNERRNSDSRKVVWNLIPVAWDYDTDDPLSYSFPGDHQLYNDPPIPGRLILCKDYINSFYEEGIRNEKHGGFSCDLHILEANSRGRGENPSFYASLRETNIDYTGDFAEAIAEIGEIYLSLHVDDEK